MWTVFHFAETKHVSGRGCPLLLCFHIPVLLLCAPASWFFQMCEFWCLSGGKQSKSLDFVLPSKMAGTLSFCWNTFQRGKDTLTKWMSLVCSGWRHRGTTASICHIAPSRTCASNSEWLQRETFAFEETKMWYSAVCNTKWIFAGGKQLSKSSWCVPLFQEDVLIPSHGLQSF